MKTLYASESHLAPEAATAADLMTPNPVSIRADVSLREALLVLHDRNIDAAPVIDEAGRAVGVISRSDLFTHDRETATRGRAATGCYGRCETRPAAGRPAPGSYPAEVSDVTRVRDVRTGAVFSVTPDTPAAGVAEQMLALNVHRLFVVAADGIVPGVITTTDVLRRLVA